MLSKSTWLSLALFVFESILPFLTAMPLCSQPSTHLQSEHALYRLPLTQTPSETGCPHLASLLWSTLPVITIYISAELCGTNA